MDNICEQLVVKTRTRGDTVKAAIIIAVMALVSGFGVVYMLQGWTILIFPIVGVDAGGIWLLKGIGVEYEYIVTNNELDIDKIVGKRKRTRLITVDLSKSIDFSVTAITTARRIQRFSLRAVLKPTLVV